MRAWCDNFFSDLNRLFPYHRIFSRHKVQTEILFAKHIIPDFLRLRIFAFIGFRVLTRPSAKGVRAGFGGV